MAVAIDSQPLIDDAVCLQCKIPPGMVWYAVLAALVDITNGDPVPTDAEELMDEARCLYSCIPVGYVPYAILGAISGLSGGGSGLLEVYQDRDPLPPNDPTKGALNYPLGGGILTQWDILSQTWV
jgi:hypothetical protein